MQRPESQSELRAQFSDSIRAAQEFKPQSLPTDLNIEAPKIDAAKIMSNDGDSAGDVADLGISKLVFDFLVQLHNRFPERKRLKFVLHRYWTITQANLALPGKLLQTMYESCIARKKDVFHKRTDENEQIVVEELSKVGYFKMCQIKTMWTPNLDIAARKAIWEHISRIIKVVSIISKFSASSRSTLNSLARDTLNDEEKSKMQSGNFDIGSLLSNIQDRVLENDDMMDSITNVAAQHNEELLSQGMTQEEISKSPF